MEHKRYQTEYGVSCTILLQIRETLEQENSTLLMLIVKKLELSQGIFSQQDKLYEAK